MNVDTIDYKGYTIRIESDDDPLNPREWDNLGTMVCWHRNYDLGDEQPSTDPEEWLRDLACKVDPTAEERIHYWECDGYDRLYSRARKDGVDPFSYAERVSDERIDAIIDKALERVFILPLYLYDHGGITMKTSNYSCPWDSGQVGYIYVTKEDVRKEWGVQRISAKLREQVYSILKSEVQVYAWYLEGQVYGFVVEDEEGEIVDSCWGFYGYRSEGYKYMVSETESAVDFEIEKREREAREERERVLARHAKQVKGWIRNNVPLQYRTAAQV